MKQISLNRLLITGSLSSFTYLLAQQPITIERNVPVSMRDGVVLRADVYEPNRDGKFPVLLERSPYDKNGGAKFAVRGAEHGYIVVVQDVRGRFASEGEWYPFKHESDDGYDTVEWAAGLPHSDGRVGMFSGSYLGATQMLAAIAHPPHLAGICAIVTPSNYHEGWTYQGGAFELWFNQSWTSSLALDSLNRVTRSNSNVLSGTEQLPLKDYSPFPLPKFSTNGGLTSLLAPYYLDWLAHPSYDEYWKQWSIEEHYANINVPALTIGAWYDVFQGGSLRNYVGMRGHAGSEAAREGQHLIMFVGGHAGFGRRVGDVDFGSNGAFAEDDAILDWYDYLFKDTKNEFATGKRVRIFVMGENQWRDEEEWPLARANNIRYFLHSSGNAASPEGNGTLSTTPPSSESNDHYTYDPSHPVPTIGGQLCCDPQQLMPGARDQRPIEVRPDVLVYSTPAFNGNVEVTGPITLELFAKSSAVDTDFTAKLVDVWPDGFAQNLTEGIIRARYRDSPKKPTLMNPHEIYKFTIDLLATSNVFLKGHKLRLEVSSSNFPRFDRNLNTGEDIAGGTKWVPATNEVFHDAQHPSALILPVVPLQQ
jgi:uncharacterized protein